MCSHNEINIDPTIDTVWGLDNCYKISCSKCKKVLYDEIPSEELNRIIEHNNYIVVAGQKYVH